MEVTARAKFVRRAPRKARQVADLVRGMRVEDALTALLFTPKHAAVDVAKAIKSAAANAEHNHSLSQDELFVKSIMVDEGPRMWRVRFVSRGRMDRYVHRTSHITVVVEDRPEQLRPTRRRPQRAVRQAEPEPASPQEPAPTSERAQAVDQAREGVE
jgi:large subunit ribosomal protein L22